MLGGGGDWYRVQSVAYERSAGGVTSGAGGSSLGSLVGGSSPRNILGGSSLGSLVGGLGGLDSGSGLRCPAEVLSSATFSRETETVRQGCPWPCVRRGWGARKGRLVW